MSHAGTEIRAWIGLGSNLGESARMLYAVLQDLQQLPGCRLLRQSGFYRTPPWGLSDQPDFINAVAEVVTRLAPAELLQQLLATERKHGRERNGPRWGPRTIDLDLLTYADQRVEADDLLIPHPRIAERAFVLLPLAELAPDLEIPGQGKVADLLARLDTTGCTRI